MQAHDKYRERLLLPASTELIFHCIAALRVYSIHAITLNLTAMITDNETDSLPADVLQEPAIDRKTLIPLWIRIFSWIFLVLGVAAPFSVVFAAIGYDFALALYGLESNGPLNLIGASLVVLFVLKGIVAYGLINIKDWAIQLAIVDAIAGIAVCLFTMFYPLFMGGGLTLKLELFLLVPYLIKMSKIKQEWEMNTGQQT